MKPAHFSVIICVKRGYVLSISLELENIKQLRDVLNNGNEGKVCQNS